MSGSIEPLDEETGEVLSRLRVEIYGELTLYGLKGDHFLVEQHNAAVEAFKAQHRDLRKKLIAAENEARKELRPEWKVEAQVFGVRETLRRSQLAPAMTMAYRGESLQVLYRLTNLKAYMAHHQRFGFGPGFRPVVKSAVYYFLVPGHDPVSGNVVMGMPGIVMSCGEGHPILKEGRTLTQEAWDRLKLGEVPESILDADYLAGCMNG